MHLRLVAIALVFLATVTGCGETVRGVVLEKHDARTGVPQSFGCTSVEWLLVIDQGERIKSTNRFKRKCVTFTTATKYTIGSKYP